MSLTMVVLAKAVRLPWTHHIVAFVLEVPLLGAVLHQLSRALFLLYIHVVACNLSVASAA